MTTTDSYTGIGEMVPKHAIQRMNLFIKENGYPAFFSAVYNGAFAEYSFSYIHPCDAMRETDNFKGIQRAFINAYV